VQPLGVALPEVEQLDVGLVVDAERDGAVDASDFDAVTWLDGVDQVVSDVQGDGAWRLASWHLVPSVVIRFFSWIDRESIDMEV